LAPTWLTNTAAKKTSAKQRKRNDERECNDNADDARRKRRESTRREGREGREKEGRGEG